MAGTMRVPRSRGAISGILLILLGAWGALIPFIGPYWDYSYTPDSTWDYTSGRLLLEILPGVGAILGGLLTLGSANRLTAMFGGWLAAVSGAWFILGMPLSSLWGSPSVGAPIGSADHQAVEYIGTFGGLGAVIIFFAAFALGRFAVLGVRESEQARRVATEEPYDDGAYDGMTDPAGPTTTDRTGATDRDATDGATDSPTDTGSHRPHWPGSRRHVGVR